MPVFFGGPVDENGELVISELQGNTTDSLRGLHVPSGAGAGGRVAASGRPLVLPDYYDTEAITHQYDVAVVAEGIRSIFAVPVRSGGRVCGVFYGATRERSAFGGRTLAVAGAAAGKMGRTLTTAPQSPAPRAPAPSPRATRTAADERAAVHAAYAAGLLAPPSS